MRRVAHYVNGQLREGWTDDGEVFDPSTGEVAALVSFATPELLDEAIQSARSAAATWARSTLAVRTEVLFAFRELLVRHSDELARLISAEHGKTIPDARGELSRGIENVEYACGLADHLKGEFSSQVADGVDGELVIGAMPYGVFDQKLKELAR